MTTAVRALVAALAASLVTLVAVAGPAAAHNSRTAFLGTYGPYDVVASVRDVDDTDAPGVLLDLTLRTEEGRDPVEDARVEVTGSADGDTAGPVDVERYGNVYRATLPGGQVERWEVSVALDGPPGTIAFDESVPGPVVLHDGIGIGPSGGAAAGGWLAAAAVALVALPLLGLTRWGREVTLAAGVVLLASCATAAAQAWTRSADAAPARALALLAPLLAAGLLVAGLVLTARRRADGRVPVFTGAAGLAVLFGVVNRQVLTRGEVPMLLSPGVARASVAVALGVGGGLAMLAVVGSRGALRALVRPPEAAPARPAD
ncbi:hypothetical protein PO878_08735 [Iamia majanohamensis]|uniref:Uncharacterized protein n=1 Tax=Iamia majanohamensis TaxID=467976 RepID=A0AAE9Y858_9ACTN|nr:hypothetical protein [Iamia majanohamensis]WCO68810.1 hypothetical protein PO878_08735 [Iamia majanohamensis]